MTQLTTGLWCGYDTINHRTVVWIWHNQPQDCGVDTPHLRWDYCHMLCNDNSNSPLSPFPKHHVQNAHTNPLQDTPLSVNH